MSAIRAPKSVKAATALLERYAQLTGEIGEIEADRSAAIAAANFASDVLATPLLTERADLFTKLAPWWGAAAAELTEGKRKSIELGGCMIGTRVGRPSLAIAGDETKIVSALEKRQWAKVLLRVTTSLDKRAILASLTGVYKKQLAELGLSKREGAETFFIERTEQGGTMAGAAT